MSEALYAWLLRLYPERFRREYGEEARRLFRDRLQNERGLLRRFRFWCDIVVDLIVSLPHEYRCAGQPVMAAAAPAFHAVAGGGPRLSAVVAGAALSLLAFSAL